MSAAGDAHNRSLLGRPGSRLRIDTPALVLDLDAFDANIAAMADLAKARGIALRPHAKTHKSAAIARAQIAAGAIGQCCAKLGEAESLADVGIEGLLVTSAIQDIGKIDRLVALLRRAPDLAIVVETPATVRALGEAVASAGLRLDVLIDCDVGTHRFGVTSPAQAAALAGLIAEHPSLRFRGVQGYAGHCQSTPDYAARRDLSHAALTILRDIRDALVEAGHACPIVTGSGTGTHDFDHEPGLLTELQVGSYIFSDVIYDGVELTPDGSRRFRNALFVHTRIVSDQHPGFATSDAGSKSFAMDGPAPTIFAGAPPGSIYDRFGDEFGKVVLPDPAARLPVGTLLACVVPHCDPNINLYDYYACVRGDRLVDLWHIEARGCAG
ncbi:MAG: DSD1 family PLP-dependent enzyme [Geminicoccaceae bacterium]